ncbi:unnamed protein product [Lampetra fluviatilis]
MGGSEARLSLDSCSDGQPRGITPASSVGFCGATLPAEGEYTGYVKCAEDEQPGNIITPGDYKFSLPPHAATSKRASERGHWATMKPLGTRRVVKARGRALAAKRPAQGPGGASDGQRMGDGEEALRCRLSTFMGKAEESPTGKGRVTAETAASFR